MTKKDNIYRIEIVSAGKNSRVTFEFDDAKTALTFAKLAKNYRDEELDVDIKVLDGGEYL